MSTEPHWFKRPSQVFKSPNSPLYDIYRKAQTLNQQLDLLETCIPPEIQGHIRIASLKDGTLHVFADSGTWASFIRYHEVEILEDLQQFVSFRHLQHIRCSVRPWYQAPRDTGPARKISEESAKHIASAAKHIKDHNLRKALMRLAESTTDDE